jgi:hypothetical protein
LLQGYKKQKARKNLNNRKYLAACEFHSIVVITEKKIIYFFIFLTTKAERRETREGLAGCLPG